MKAHGGEGEGPVRLRSGWWRSEAASGGDHAVFAERQRASEWARLAGRTPEPPSVLAALMRGRTGPLSAPVALPLSVVVVDDEARDRVAVAVALDDRRWRIIGEGCDGHEAIALARALHPDVIVLDVYMPGLDGLSALPAIRRASPDSIVVLFSGTTPDDHLGDGFVRKDDCAELETALLALTA